MRRLPLAYAAAIVATLVPLTAAAQAGRSGATFTIGAQMAPADNVDVAYDSVNDRYLSVSQNGPGDTKTIDARLVNAAGTVVGNFTVNQSGVANVQSPRAAFSPDIGSSGGFLITWHQGVPFSQVRGRIVGANGSPLTDDFVIAVSTVSSATQSNWTMGAAVAYSTRSDEFLVAWMGGYGSTNDIYYARVSTRGELLTSEGAAPAQNRVITAGTSDWERDPSVAYNPDENVFYIAYGGYDEARRYGYAGGQRVEAGTGRMLGEPQRFGAALSTYVPAVTYNTRTRQYLLGWYNRTTAFAAVYGVVLRGSDAAQVGDIRVLSGFYSAYDALDIDYNPPSGQYMLVTHGGGSRDWEDAGVSILADGTPYDNGFFVTETATGEGNFNPRMAASTTEPKWLVVTAHKHASIFGQFVVTGATGGGTPPPSPTPPPAPAPLSVTALTSSTGFAAMSYNTAVTFTATTAGGTGGVQYQFWRYSYPLSRWVIGQSWSNSSSWTYVPGTFDGGWQKVQVWARNAGASGDPAWKDSNPFRVITPGPRLLWAGVSDSQGSPIETGTPGTPLKITALAGGGQTGVIEYQFWRYNTSTARWSLDRPWSTNNFYTWTPGALEEGTFVVQVWIRELGNSAMQDWTRLEFLVSDISVSSLTPMSGTVSASTSPVVNLVASGSGNPAGYEYKFWRYNYSTGWKLLRDYGTNNTLQWSLGSDDHGSNVVQVWLRSVGSNASWAAWKATNVITIAP